MVAGGDTPPVQPSCWQKSVAWLIARRAKLQAWVSGLPQTSLRWRLVHLLSAAVIVFGIVGVVDVLPWWVGLLIVVCGVLAAIDAVVDERWGTMVSLKGTDVVNVSIADATGGLKTVPQSRYDEAALLFG